MRKSIIISADSACDLPQELVERYDIKILPLTITTGEKSLLDGVDISADDICAGYKLDGTVPKTSAPNLQQFLDFFSCYAESGAEIVHLDISSKLSGTYNTACIAAKEFEGVYPIDSCQLSSGIGLLVIEAAECRDKGMSASEIAAHLNELKDKVDTSFVLDTLEFMSKGGRCSAVAALGANLLKIKPALEMKDGKLSVYKKYRGNSASVYKKYMEERIAGTELGTGHVFFTDSGEIDAETLEGLENIVRNAFPAAEIHRNRAGCTITSHCGPRAIGVLFIRR